MSESRFMDKPPAATDRVKIRLRYIIRLDGEKIPWKWQAACPCHWNLLSWDWERTIIHVDNHIRAEHSGDAMLMRLMRNVEP